MTRRPLVVSSFADLHPPPSLSFSSGFRAPTATTRFCRVSRPWATYQTGSLNAFPHNTFRSLSYFAHHLTGSSLTSTLSTRNLYRTRQGGPQSMLHDENNNERNTNDNDDDDDNRQACKTWKQVPYESSLSKSSNNASQQQSNTHTKRTFFSTWTVPKTIDIPDDRLDISFVRSSGAGGQNVNKVNTKVELRVHVMDATWIGPEEVRRRLAEQQANRINKDGVLSLTVQEYRTQGQNKKAAIEKLRQMILQAWPRPKVRKQRTGVSKAAKERKKEFKRKRSDVKERRKKVDW